MWPWLLSKKLSSRGQVRIKETVGPVCKGTLNEQRRWIVGSIFSSQQGKRKSTVWDGQSCMILIRLRPLTNPSLTPLSPLIFSQGRFWCTASWEWVDRPLWSWPTSCWGSVSLWEMLWGTLSKNGPFTPTGTSCLSSWSWMNSWHEKGVCALFSDNRSFHSLALSYLKISLCVTLQPIKWQCL